LGGCRRTHAVTTPSGRFVPLIVAVAEPRSNRRSENTGFISFSLYFFPTFGAIVFVPRELFLEAKEEG
jgi:hypothetical protein